MKKNSKIILAVVLAIILIPCILMYLRYRSNVALGHELRKEADAWLASLPKIPESENGAPIINKAVEQFDDFYDVFQDWDPRIDSEAAATTFRNYLAGKKEAFGLLEKGLAYEKCIYTTDYEKGCDAAIPNLLLFKTTGRIFALKGDLARKQQRNSDALREYLKVLQLASTLSEERNIISQMIYFATCSIGLKRVADLVQSQDLAEQELSHVLEKFLEFRKEPVGVSVALETEYFIFVMMVSDVLEGKTTMRELATGEKDESGLWGRFVTSKWMYDYGLDVGIYRRWREVVKQVDPAKYYDWPEDLHSSVETIFHEFGVRFGEPKAIMAQIAIPNLQESFKVETENITMFRGTIALVAVKLREAKRGVLPRSLDELGELVPKEILIDPFSGKELIYRREGDDFYLYSAGYNGTDDKCKDSRPVFEEGIYPEEVEDMVFHTPPLGK